MDIILWDRDCHVGFSRPVLLVSGPGPYFWYLDGSLAVHDRGGRHGWVALAVCAGPNFVSIIVGFFIRPFKPLG